MNITVTQTTQTEVIFNLNKRPRSRVPVESPPLTVEHMANMVGHLEELNVPETAHLVNSGNGIYKVRYAHTVDHSPVV